MHLCQHASRWSEGLLFYQIIWSSDSWCLNDGNILQNCNHKNAPSYLTKNWKLCQDFIICMSKAYQIIVNYILHIRKIVKTKKVRNFIHLIYSATRYHQQDRDSWELKKRLTYTRNWKWCQGFHNLDVHSISEYCQVL